MRKKSGEKRREVLNNPAGMRYFILCLFLIALAAIGVALWALFFKDVAPVLPPDYAPETQEKNAVPIPNDTTEAENAQSNNSVSLRYSPEAEVYLNTQSISLYFANPGKSCQNMVIQVIIQDTTIAQSGTLCPGYQITQLELLPDMETRLSSGGYEGKFVIYYYDPTTGERAPVNTEIPLTLQVMP